MKFYKEDNESPAAIQYATTAPAGFSEIADAAELKACFLNLFKEYAEDGLATYNDIRVDIYIDLHNATITQAQAFAVESHLKDLASQLRVGNWLTAQDTNSSLALSGIYDQAMKDSIQTTLDDYVTANY